MHIRQAFILAAGYGTRLRPLTLDTPKPLIPVAGKPLLEYHLLNLKKHGITQVFINTFYLSEKIEEYIASLDIDLDIIISREEGEILGTAGGVMKQIDTLDDQFLIVYGDNLTNCDYTKYFSYLEGKEFDASIALYNEPHIEEKGMAVLNEQGYISTFIEKPKPEQVVSHLANAGIYILKKDIFQKYTPTTGFFDFGHDFFPALLADHKKILPYTMADYLLDIGNHTNLAKANEFLAEHGSDFL